ncbi:hypothetical protein PLESTM_001821000 [Pleodorina starrii]|nr:hypothetical protein PLESTM_001821000 [Pleodorina starrii]
MWKSASWIERLNMLPGLNLDDKARARVIILSKPGEDRALYLEGTYTEAAATIRALLRETPMVSLEASASSLPPSDASALSLPSCCTTTTTITRDSITTSRSGATTTTTTTSAASNPSTSSSSTASTASRRPLSAALLVSTAASIHNLATLPAAFRAAHFWASQPGDVYCRTVRKLVPVTISSSGGDNGDGGGGGPRTVVYECGETRFAMVVSVSPPAKDGSSPGAVIAIRIRAAEEVRRLRPLPPSHRDDGAAATRSQKPPDVAAAAKKEEKEIEKKENDKKENEKENEEELEFESEVVADPRDSLKALTARLERREVRAAEVLWWQRGPGKWTLWDGSPQRAWRVRGKT